MTNWIIPSKIKNYRLDDFFMDYGFIDREMGNRKFELNDIVYLYVSAPKSAILYKTRVVKVEMSPLERMDDEDYWLEPDKDRPKKDNFYMRLELLESYEKEKFGLEKLKKVGLSHAPMGAQRLKDETVSYLEEKSRDAYGPGVDDLDEADIYEGAKKTIEVNSYERNPIARKKALDYYGYDCRACGFNFEEKFGECGKNFIHVHHLVPLKDIDKSYKIDPIKDLIPLCPNCHAMAHRGYKLNINKEKKKSK